MRRATQIYCSEDCRNIYATMLRAARYPVTIICHVCQQPFEKFSPYERHASKDCVKKHDINSLRTKVVRKRSCPECKNDFKADDSSQIFCSEECRVSHHNKVKAIPAGKLKTCPNCKKTFTTLSKNKFCSISCKTYYKSKKYRS